YLNDGRVTNDSIYGDMIMFDTNSTSLTNPLLPNANAPKALKHYTAVLLKNGIIIYIGGIDKNYAQQLAEADMYK
ncbi:27543_t:CDS:1, partial [Racocetra persica]